MTESELGVTVRDKCSHCKGGLGQPHDKDCVKVHQRVRVRVTIEVDIDKPHDWDKHMIEFHLNESSWCASNIIREMAVACDEDRECPCGCTRVELVKVIDATPTTEKRPLTWAND